MKKLILGLIVAAFAYNATASVVSTNLATAGTHMLVTGIANVYAVEISSPSNNIVKFYDQYKLTAPESGTNIVIPAYTNVVVVATNIVNNFTNYLGAITVTTNVGQASIITANAQATNALPVMLSGAVAANTVSSYTTEAMFSRGVVVTTSAGSCNVTIMYRP